MKDRAISLHGDDQVNQPSFDRLKLYFAILTVLGGFALAVGNDGAVIPIIAVFFAIVGYLFVDVLQLFWLPAPAAYIAMALAAVFCIIDFADGDSAGPRQLLAVSHLLVIVQAILMMQRKSKRIFEQLAIFCLLELIVAAVFNDALSFGLLLIPVGVIGAMALGLLATVATTGGPASDESLDRSGDSIDLEPVIRIDVGESTRLAAKLANRYANISTLILVPSIVSVALVFFYALPRTSEASRNSRLGNALVGFSEQVQLEQLGHMLLNPEIAMHIDLSDRFTGKNYRTYGGIYLRGRTLEQYESKTIDNRQTATWKAVPIDPKRELLALPSEYFPKRSTDANFYDTVDVSISCKPMRTSALFSIAPYYRMNQSQNIVHMSDRWTIRRRGSRELIPPPIEYVFGTNAFHKGIQAELIARWSQSNSSALSISEVVDSSQSNLAIGPADKSVRYRQMLLEFDSKTMPSIAQIANDYALDRSGKRRTDVEIAKAIEQHFKAPGRYRYSLDLRMDTVPDLDPIEQFVAVDQRGHCQYFASAMAMMLRSQNIPTRVVVGYYTDEYNEWTGQYIARQSHAHAWVEALIDHDQINQYRMVYGQPPSDQYWLRLDPTPAASGGAQSPGTIRQSIDLAQDLWDDYVVEMDADRQQDSVMAGGIRPSGPWYDNAVDWLSGQIRRIQAGDLGGGSLAGREVFSWPAAIGGIVAFVALLVLLRI
ncbi:MAG: DUF3488 domain-containing protein, partial [Pirellulaceae bacterium]|nr:DUF3488 domain-containing protein [Pirellulaceae bacterium]